MLQWSGFTDRQERFLNDIFTNRSKDIFSGVSMMLFVFDVASDQQEVFSPILTSLLLGGLEDLPASHGEAQHVQRQLARLRPGPQDGQDPTVRKSQCFLFPPPLPRRNSVFIQKKPPASPKESPSASSAPPSGTKPSISYIPEIPPILGVVERDPKPRSRLPASPEAAQHDRGAHGVRRAGFVRAIDVFGACELEQ